KLQNLKQKLDGIDQAAVGRGKWDSFKDLGAKAGTKGGVLGQLKEQTGSGKKQEMIFGSKGSQLSTFGGSLVSNEPAGGAGGADGAKDDATLEKGAKGLSLLISLVSSRSAPIPMPSTPSSREEVRNLRSFAAILKTLIGGDYSGHVDRRGGIDPKDKTPTPDGDATGGRTIITSEQLRGLAAILGSLIEPADTGSTGSGGPVNEGATPAGLLQALAEFADGQVPGGVTTITDTDLRGIEARLNQLINRVEKVEVES
ncbi:MAG TPA: hypothetical protein VMT16_06850, partial [Thermoanaerobaculia bacterium]|nr:hypothetical protein [Thermoanaerobaculia bacterium]